MRLSPRDHPVPRWWFSARADRLGHDLHARDALRRAANDEGDRGRLRHPRGPAPRQGDRGQEAGPDARAPAEGRRGRPARSRRPRGVRRPRRRQDQLQPDHGGGQPPRIVGGQLRRPRGHRHDADRAVRDARAAQEVPAQAGVGRDDRRLRAHRAGLRVGRARGEDQGGQVRRRQELEAHRVEAVHHQRRLRRSVHGVREGGRRAVHRLPDRAQRAGADHRPRGAQARHPRQLDLPAVPRGLHDPDRRGAGDDRPGAQDRLQHPQHRALEAGRRRRSRARSTAWSWA